MDERLQQLARQIRAGDRTLLPSYAAAQCRLHGHIWRNLRDYQGSFIDIFETLEICCRCSTTNIKIKEIPLPFYEAPPSFLTIRVKGGAKRHYAVEAYSGIQYSGLTKTIVHKKACFYTTCSSNSAIDGIPFDSWDEIVKECYDVPATCKRCIAKGHPNKKTIDSIMVVLATIFAEVAVTAVPKHYRWTIDCSEQALTLTPSPASGLADR